MPKRPKNEYENWIHLLSETSAVRELLAAELENLPQDCNMELLKETILESRQTRMFISCLCGTRLSKTWNWQSNGGILYERIEKRTD